MHSAARLNVLANKPEKMSPKLFLFTRSLVPAVLLVSIAVAAVGQKTAAPKISAPLPDNSPAITQIDEAALKKLLVPNGKPLLINFWATWCDPCREEFPELVKINAAYKGKIDFITISLDDLADINTAVPKFLSEMHADMPAFLLKAADDETAMKSVSANWAGGLPFTILFNEKGGTAYYRQGKVRPDILRAELTKETAALP
jgi:thiol-disulfide isomerase/thioredoxin